MSEACPPPDRVFLAARGELEAVEAGAVRAHAAECEGCGAAWHMAAVARPMEAGEAGPGESPALPSGRVTGAIAAVVVVAGVLAWLLGPGG